jgi:hypothetical protein
MDPVMGPKTSKLKGCNKRLNINSQGCADFVHHQEHSFICNVHPQRPAAFAHDKPLIDELFNPSRF